MAVSGANFAVAETGTLVVVESEGNGRMCLTLPETLVTVVGIEKLVPTWADLEVFLRLLPRSSTGERMNPYTSTWTGVTPGDGPQEVHIVLLDNGRTRALADEVGRQALRCIRCSACLNVCPVYERSAGTRTARSTPARSARSSTRCSAAWGTTRRWTRCPTPRRCAARATTSARSRSTSPEVLVHLRPRSWTRTATTRCPRPEALAMRAPAWGMADARRMRRRRAPRRTPGSSAGRWPTDAGRAPRAVPAAVARVALDAGPRPAAPAARVVPGLVAPARPRRGGAVTARDDVLAAVRAALGPGRDGGADGDGHASNGRGGTASVEPAVGALARRQSTQPRWSTCSPNGSPTTEPP